MAHVQFTEVKKVTVKSIDIERTPDIHGEMALDSRVSETYKLKQYDAAPKSEEEARALGKSSWNGLQSSVVRMRYDDYEDHLELDVAPTRYFIGQAARSFLAQKGTLSDVELEKLNPRMLGVSLLARHYEGSHEYLIGQVKGKTLGSGQVHAALAAGNVDSVALEMANPLEYALALECAEEVNHKLENPVPCGLVVEPEVGCVNVAYEADIDLETVARNYLSHALATLARGEELEVKALALIRIPTIYSPEGTIECVCLTPNLEKGCLDRTVETKEIRPYTKAALDRSLMRDLGFSGLFKD